MLNPSSKLKGEKDWKKYEMARKLKSKIHTIRENYKTDMKSKEMKVRQRAVALYFIDKVKLLEWFLGLMFVQIPRFSCEIPYTGSEYRLLCFLVACSESG